MKRVEFLQNDEENVVGIALIEGEYRSEFFLHKGMFHERISTMVQNQGKVVAVNLDEWNQQKNWNDLLVGKTVSLEEAIRMSNNE